MLSNINGIDKTIRYIVKESNADYVPTKMGFRLEFYDDYTPEERQVLCALNPYRYRGFSKVMW